MGSKDIDLTFFFFSWGVSDEAEDVGELEELDVDLSSPYNQKFKLNFFIVFAYAHGQTVRWAVNLKTCETIQMCYNRCSDN